MIKEINTVKGSERELKILTTKAVECGTIFNENGEKAWDAVTLEWIENLKDTAKSKTNEAIGLACRQIWDDENNPPLKMFAIRVTPDTWKIYINPKLELSGKPADVFEGCLSQPNKKLKIRRRQNVAITYQVPERPGPEFTDKCYFSASFLPIVLQHEYDHLLGIVQK